MGKRKGGLTGLSRFVLESFKSGSASNIPTELPDSQNVFSEDRPSKKQRTDDGISAQPSLTAKSAWIDQYDATGLVPHYSQANQVPEYLQKYFSQRTRFFSLYSKSPGCLLDEEGWYSVTPELIADQIAERCRCDTILDAFCGVGGNAIAFAKTCQRVIALDTSATRLALARHNAQIYGVADRIEFILTDYISFANSYLSHNAFSKNNHQRKIDVVFLSPPWGGPAYLSSSPDSVISSPTKDFTDITHPSYSLSTIQPIHGRELFRLSRKITKNIAFYLPRNTCLDEISDLLLSEPTVGDVNPENGENRKKKENVEVEEEWMGNKLKALTCYFGGLVDRQEDLF